MYPILHFALLLGVQAVCLIGVGYVVGSLRSMRPRLLLTCSALGLVTGVICDYVCVNILDIYSYTFSLNIAFLVVNGIFSYGIMMATVALMQGLTFMRFWAWTSLVGFVYEAANVYLEIWQWHFAHSVFVEELIIIFAASTGLSMIMAVGLQLFHIASFRMFAHGY